MNVFIVQKKILYSILSNEHLQLQILDSRNDISILDDGNVSHTFDIQNELEENESYRFLRLRQTGPNTQGSNY